MNLEFELNTDTIDVPKNTGVEGFLLAIRQILKRRQFVQKIEIDARGKITCSYYARTEDNQAPIEIDFESVTPSAAIRNGEVVEVVLDNWTCPACVVAKMFRQVSIDRLFPVAFVTGANTVFFEWMESRTGICFPDGMACGFPVLRDRHIPDESLILATSFGPHGALVDTYRSYKIRMPARTQPVANPELQSITPDAVEVVTS